jgi:hypothetical protein
LVLAVVVSPPVEQTEAAPVDREGVSPSDSEETLPDRSAELQRLLEQTTASQQRQIAALERG